MRKRNPSRTFIDDPFYVDCYLPVDCLTECYSRRKWIQLVDTVDRVIVTGWIRGIHVVGPGQVFVTFITKEGYKIELNYMAYGISWAFRWIA